MRKKEFSHSYLEILSKEKEVQIEKNKQLHDFTVIKPILK